MIASGKPVINMGIGSPDLYPPSYVIDALKEAVHDQGAHQYQSYQGIPELRQAMANYYKKCFGVSLDPNSEILPLIGSKEGIMHISMAFLDKGDEVLIPNPGYPTYGAVTRLVGAVPRTYDLSESNNWLPDLEALNRESLNKVKLMWINYPHMPTGGTARVKDFEALVKFARSNGILLINDNPYGHILTKYPRSILQVKGAKDIALELNSLSKTFNMAGWRVGMVLGNESLISAILKVKSNMDSGMFYGVQRGAIAALESKKDWYGELNEVYTRRRKLMWQFADKLSCRYDEDAAGMFVWCSIPDGMGSSNQLSDRLLYENHIFVAPGTVFGSHGEGYIRLSLCVPEELIKEAIDRI